MAIALFLGAAPPPARAALPTTPTVDHDKDATARSMTLIFYAIPNPGGTRTVVISCDNGTTSSDPYAFASRVDVSLDLPGCEGYGRKLVAVRVLADDVDIFLGYIHAAISPELTLGTPEPAITGHRFTFVPTFPADYQLPAGSVCRYEFRWGNDFSLDTNDYDETFGALGFDANARNGSCPIWSFTLPWVPYRQYELFLGADASDGQYDAYVRFHAAEDGTGRLIKESNLPIVQVLPSTYTPIVGEAITYTRHLIGGASAGSSSTWNAWQGRDPDLNHWTQDGGASFTIRPWETGNVTVSWQRGGEKLFYAMYDPPVRRRDTYRPTTTKPVARISPAAVGGSTVPVTLTWDGSDRGWGIAKYQLERSTDGGAWKRVLARKTKTFATSLAPGHAYRFRVRAIDKYGNRGDWDIGPSFRPAVVEDGSAAIGYSGDWAATADTTARGGSIHEASGAASRAVITFTGRDIAWLAERGPGHGAAKVYVDGALAATVDLNAATDAPARVVFRRHWAVKDAHTVRIVVSGTAGRPIVGVDGFALLR